MNLAHSKFCVRTIYMSRTTVAVGQMRCNENKDENLLNGLSLVRRAKSSGAAMLFLPECFDFISSSRNNLFNISERVSGHLISTYKKAALEHQIWISLGGFHQLVEENRVKNTHIVINSNGDIAAMYDKVHLFDIDIKDKLTLKESDYTVPGGRLIAPVKTPIGQVAIQTCYDVRFPEASSLLRRVGAEILTFPSAFTEHTGRAHWMALMRARAIDNQCFVVSAAQIGQHNAKRASYGHSTVVDPWGDVLWECPDDEDLGIVEIDLSKLQRVRQNMPLENHRRPELYYSIPCQSLIQEQQEYNFGEKTIGSYPVFLRTSLSFAFVNRKPVLPGHVLVSPLRRAPRVSDLTPDEAADLFLVSRRVGAVVERHWHASSLSFSIQDGPDSGQTVPHVHMHILPRKPGDFCHSDEVEEKLASHDKDDSGFRSEEEMRAEAALLRTYFE